jgi:hypothetical protein
MNAISVLYRIMLSVDKRVWIILLSRLAALSYQVYENNRDSNSGRWTAKHRSGPVKQRNQQASSAATKRARVIASTDKTEKRM